MFDALWRLIASLFDKLAFILPDWSLGISLVQPFRVIKEVIELIGYMFPPVVLIAKLLGVWLGLEIALWAWFAINWLISKIPFVG